MGLMCGVMDTAGYVQVLNSTDGCGDNCGLHGGSHIRGDVAALNGFHVVWKFYNLNPTASFLELEKGGKEFCNRPWNDIEEVSECRSIWQKSPQSCWLLQRTAKESHSRIALVSLLHISVHFW